MSRVRQELSVVQFQVETRQASASMDALRERAKNLNRDITTTKESIKALGDVKPDDAALVGYQTQLKKLGSDLRDVTRAQNELMKGVKAADKLWKAAATGTMESLSVKEIKAGQRGMQARMQNLQPSKENARELLAMKIAIEEGDIAIRKFEADTTHLLETITQGGAVSNNVLTKAKNDLNGLLDVLPRGTDEWNKYNAQLQNITKYIDGLSESERRLSGEVVTVADAMKLASAASKEETEQRAFMADINKQLATQERERAEGAAQLAKTNTAMMEQELATTKEQMTAQRQLVGSIEALEDAESQAFSKMLAADTALEKQQEETRKFSEAAWEAAKKVGELKEKLEELNATGSAHVGKPTQEQLERLRNDFDKANEKVKRLDESLKQLKATEAQPTKVTFVEELEKKIEKAERAIQEREQKLKGLKELSIIQTDSGTRNDFKNEAIIEANKHLGSEDAAKMQSMSLEEIINQGPSGNAKYDKYISSIRKQFTAWNEDAIRLAESGLARLRTELNGLRSELDKTQKTGYAATNNASAIRDKEEELRRAIGEQTEARRKLAEAEKQTMETTQSSINVDKQKAELQQQLADAQTKLNEAKAAAEGPTKALKDAEDAYAEAEKREQEATEALAKAKKNMNLGEEEQKLDALERQHDELTESLQKQKQAEQDLAQAAAEAQQKEKEAAIELAQAQNVTQESLENSISILEKQQKKTADGTPEYEKQAEALDKLRSRLNEIKGEWMGLADAQALAKEAGTDAFIASPQQLQKATAAIERRKKQLQETIQLQRRSGEATDAEERELMELEVQLKKLEMEQDNFNMSHKRMDELLRRPSNAKNLDELRAAIKRAKAELNAMEDSLGKNSDAYRKMAADTKKAEFQLKDMETQAKGTASAFSKAWSRLKTYVGLYVGASEALQRFTATMGDLLELSDKMGEVRKTTGFTADEVGRLTTNIKRLDTRTSLTSLMEMSSLAGSVGLKTQQDIQGFTEASNQLIVSLPELGNESARTLIKIANATGDLEKNNNDVRETLEKVGSTIIALRANSASAAGPITDFVSRVGAVGAQAGISIDQIAALGSTIDALGGRVEMSATALSRMIPAIKNNSFAIANSIGVTEKYLKSLAPMEQMVLIFQKMRDNIAGIDTSTEAGQEQMAQTIEGMLGKNATMREVMKDLEQQGARAGIVFGLLSQNVDELQRQLGIAGQAYSDNTALLAEYNNMNETAAAKWERLKNQVEEFFVGDSAQKTLGQIIDGLRKVVDLLTGNSGIGVALRTIIVYMGMVRLQIVSIVSGALKSLGVGLKNIGIMLGFIKGEMTLMQWGNIFTAAAAAVYYLVTQLRELYKEAHQVETIVSEVLSRYTTELDAATKKVDKMFESVGNARVAVKDTNEEVKKAEEALKQAKNALDEGTGSTKQLEEAENNLKVAHEKVTRANLDHKSSIEQINREYSPYLGYMLSEISTAREVANARELINAKLRETILLKQQEAGYQRIEGAFGQKRDERQQAIYDLIGENVSDPEAAARMRKDILDLVKQAKDGSKTILDIRKEWERIYKESGVEFSMGDYQGMESYIWRLVTTEREIQDAKKLIDENVKADIKAARVGTMNTKGTQQELQDQLNAIYNGDKGKNNGLQQLQQLYEKADAKTRKQRAADLLKQMDAYESLIGNAQNYYDLQEKDEEASYKKLVSNSDNRMRDLRSQREALIKEAGDAYKPVQGPSATNSFNNGSNSPTPYGTYNRITSPYIDWDADALVARRKEMLERVRALANGADVQAVLSEDAKFITEATRKNIKTTRDAIEWYNTERLKIQDALHEKHLTNTGDWMDPKKAKGRKKLLHDEWRAYLEELDAYYTERKTRIQEAGTEEGITEAEVKNRTLANEMEWHQRRAELQKLYADKSREVTAEEQQAIFDIIAERTENSSEMVEKTIAQTVRFMQQIGIKAPVELEEALAQLGLGWERDFLKQQQAVTAQMKAIQDIIEKERPYDGITRNLRENLVTMGILTADMSEERNRLMRENADMSDFNSRQAAAELKRTAFVLREAESAYSTTIEEIMSHMGEQGMQAWADAISGDEKMQQALMAQLRTTYDAIQDAIKKEASLIKKQTDIWWADIEKGQTVSRRDGFEKMLSQLGLAEDQVKRANSLIGAGPASERVADKLAIKQMQVRLAMQTAYYNKMRQIGEARIRQLETENKLEDAEHLRRSLNLAKTEELKKLEEQRVAIANQMEESQNRLYIALKEWADLLSSSLQSVFEASHAGDAEYYNELAKLSLTGKGGPGAGTYIVIDNEGSSDAKAHYEYLDEREALERQHKIERENALADAWKKVMDDINMKMSETITDQINAMLQNMSLDANTQAVLANTEAIYASIRQEAEGDTTNGGSAGITAAGETISGELSPIAQKQIEESNHVTSNIEENARKQAQATTDAGKKMSQSTQSTFAKMTQAANLYGIAYQAMSNENISATQKLEMIALQAVGNAAISGLTALMEFAKADAAAKTPGVLGKLWSQLGWAAPPVFAVFTGLLGGLMGLATSKIQKSKGTIAQVTGASGASAGRLATGMLTYGEGNVNEFTDPSTLTPGRRYNVDGADGKTYRARYMGKGAKTHITNGPEFHLVGEEGREAIIDAKTTRLLQMNDNGIWRAIQTLYNGGNIGFTRRRRGIGIPAFAEGNIDEFIESTEINNSATNMGGMSPDQMLAFQASLDRNSEIMENIAANGIKGVFSIYGKDGLVDSYDRGKKTLNRYGERY